MGLRFSVQDNADPVRAAIEGDGDADEFIGLLRELGGRSVGWPSARLLVDLRGVQTLYSFTDQLRIGEAVGVNFRHLRKHAAVVRPDRITRVGEKAAQHQGTRVRVFASEHEALAWLDDPDPGR